MAGIRYFLASITSKYTVVFESLIRNFTTSQEITSNLWDSEIYYGVHKSPLLVQIQSQMNPVQNLLLHKFRLSMISQQQLCRPRCKFPGALGMSLQIGFCRKVPACLQFVLLETRQQTVKAPYEPSS